ncbi:hypothetical protein PCL_04977 [Purpureocillium lilacinum]|uniref:Uncharacterized protein n=1 Tax=Purpureocillium lilacinum TaxID=33203 RepID=A0A2U3DWG4_PURLI|nr:hypothetical protein PCL_04977 [Purpureocillium lilacinum]
MKYQLLLAALVASATAELPPLEKWKYTGKCKADTQTCHHLVKTDKGGLEVDWTKKMEKQSLNESKVRLQFRTDELRWFAMRGLHHWREKIN